MYYMGVQIPHAKGQLGEWRNVVYSVGKVCRELRKNGRSNRDVVWGAHSAEFRENYVFDGVQIPVREATILGCLTD